MNIAGVWKLPVIFLCENNQYALSTPAHTVTSGVIADRAAGFGMPGVRVENGQDVLAVYEAVQRRPSSGPAAATARAWSRSSPTGSTSTPRACASAWTTATSDEKAAWLERDPIVLFRTWLVEHGVATEEQLDALDAEVRAEVDESVAFTDASPFPDPSRAFADLYTEPFGPTHTSRHGPGHPDDGAVR